jgi:hypothetical protein
MTRERRFALIEPSLKTGDLVLFAGKGLASNSIKWVTLSRWSHVAMVLRTPEQRDPCLWEASTDVSVPGIDGRPARSGVQLVALRQRLLRYDGEFAVRRLVGARLAPGDLAALARLRRRLLFRPYESSTRQLMAAAYDGPGGEQRECLQELFCSELIAETYQALRLLDDRPGSKPSNEYTPADFSQQHEALHWRRGRLGPEILLTL